MNIDENTRDTIYTLLENLCKENTGWRRWFSRWKISDEPLRGDAKHVLEFLQRLERNEEAARASIAASAKYAHIKPRQG